MLFDFAPTDGSIGDTLICETKAGRWGADSEYGRLLDVMVSAPAHLEIVPCNTVAIEHHRNGLSCCPDRAGEQHAALVAALEHQGVRCHLVPPVENLPDLSFTRDATLMTPWGLLGLNPAVGHRAREVAHVQSAAKTWGVPLIGAIEEGRAEGGDVCLLRPGLVAIGYSGDRTDERGATALAKLFESRGWEAISCRFDPHFLHLDTLFTLADRTRAVACVEALEPAFLTRLQALGVDLVPVSYSEVQRLGANILSLGDARLLSSSENVRLNGVLRRLGYTVAEVEIDQFVRCGGGIHCLTMPLARAR